MAGENAEDYGLAQGETAAAKGTLEQAQRQGDVKSWKHQGTQNGGILSLAFTILRACPLGDTIAILLVLLWLPPTLLTITNTLFAVLTFMPATLALPSFPPNVSDIFIGTGSTPSLATIFITDIIGLLLWLLMWTPIQTLAIELAQAVVATTLGGGSSSKRRGSDSTLLCVSLVTINHITHHEWLPRRIFGFDWSDILSKIPYVPKDPLLFVSSDDYNPTRSTAGWIRVLVALHILIQGFVHVLRRWYQKREYAQAARNSKKVDQDSASASPSRTGSASTVEAGSLVHPTSAMENSGRSGGSKEAREKVLTGKKKRKQGTVVRSQQPLWAAFAATKLTILREYEQSQAVKEVVEAKAVDTKNLGSVPFAGEVDRVWIFDLRPNSFRFSTTLLLDDAPDKVSPEDDTTPTKINTDVLQVRINDTDWTSASIQRGSRAANGNEEWQGEVFGLSPASSFRCDFIQSKAGVILYSVTVTTPALLPVDTGENTTSGAVEHVLNQLTESATIATETPQQAYRPSSPTSPKTTLRRSISAFEASLAESQSRQKRNKKDNKAALANLKKDIDVLNSKITKLGGEDKAQLNRQLQWNLHTKQADEAFAAMSDEVESLGAPPAEDVKLSEETKDSWEEAKNTQSAAREELAHVKEAANNEKATVQAEVSASQQKRERLLARNNKLRDQYERLDSVTASNIDAKERQDSLEAAKELERAQIDRRNAEQMAAFYQAYQESRYFVQQAWSQIQVLEAAFQEHQVLGSMPPPEARPLTPEGDLPGTNPKKSQAAAFRGPMFGSPDAPILGLRSHSGSLRHGDTRPRSTSGVSANSFYAEFEDQDPAPPMPSRAVEKIRERGRQHSGGSGSGSSGSQRDPASPLVGSGVQASPVGKRSPVWNS